MTTIELQAKSIDEAKQLAAEKLGVSESQVVLDVLEETKGLFGKSVVRVKASVGEEKAAPAKKTRAKAEKPAPEPAEEEPAPKAKPAKAAKPARATKAAPKAEEPQAAAPADDDEEEAAVEVVATEADAQKIESIMNEILRLAELNATATQSGINGRYVNVVLDGKDVAYLVGKHGEVLNNLQYLLNVILNRQLNNGVRATIDGNEYRQRREEALTKLATDIAEQVKQRGEEAVLDALPAFERRVVHRALVEFTGVTTYSEGEEPNRRVVIAPSQ